MSTPGSADRASATKSSQQVGRPARAWRRALRSLSPSSSTSDVGLVVGHQRRRSGRRARPASSPTAPRGPGRTPGRRSPASRSRRRRCRWRSLRGPTKSTATPCAGQVLPEPVAPGPVTRGALRDRVAHDEDPDRVGGRGLRAPGPERTRVRPAPGRPHSWMRFCVGSASPAGELLAERLERLVGGERTALAAALAALVTLGVGRSRWSRTWPRRPRPPPWRPPPAA